MVDTQRKFVILSVNGRRFEILVCREHNEAVKQLAASFLAGNNFGRFDSAVDDLLGRGALKLIFQKRKPDIFDKITLAVYICAVYAKDA